MVGDGGEVIQDTGRPREVALSLSTIMLNVQTFLLCGHFVPAVCAHALEESYFMCLS